MWGALVTHSGNTPSHCSKREATAPGARASRPCLSVYSGSRAGTLELSCLPRCSASKLGRFFVRVSRAFLRPSNRELARFCRQWSSGFRTLVGMAVSGHVPSVRVPRTSSWPPCRDMARNSHANQRPKTRCFPRSDRGRGAPAVDHAAAHDPRLLPAVAGHLLPRRRAGRAGPGVAQLRAGVRASACWPTGKFLKNLGFFKSYWD